MVPENPKERLVGAQAIVAAKRARAKAVQAPCEGAGAAAGNPTEAEPAVAPPPAADAPLASVPLPVQAREVSASQEPRAHTTCKRCAATVDADAAECWNCSLPL